MRSPAFRLRAVTHREAACDALEAGPYTRPPLSRKDGRHGGASVALYRRPSQPRPHQSGASPDRAERENERVGTVGITQALGESNQERASNGAPTLPEAAGSETAQRPKEGRDGK